MDESDFREQVERRAQGVAERYCFKPIVQAEGAEPPTITGHAFEPRLYTDPSTAGVVAVGRGVEVYEARKALMPNPYLCQVCRLAEAAHLSSAADLNTRTVKPLAVLNQGVDRVEDFGGMASESDLGRGSGYDGRYDPLG